MQGWVGLRWDESTTAAASRRLLRELKGSVFTQRSTDTFSRVLRLCRSSSITHSKPRSLELPGVEETQAVCFCRTQDESAGSVEPGDVSVC